MQVQDLALARQEIVLDVEALHGLEVATEDGGRDQLGDLRQCRCRPVSIACSVCRRTF